MIQGFLELATENPNLNEEDRLHWEMMLEQAERMRALVDDLLALSRLEQDAARHHASSSMSMKSWKRQLPKDA